MSNETTAGPFAIGDTVKVFSGDHWIADGVIDGEHPPPAADGPNGEWLCDVRSTTSGSRFDRWSECDLGLAGGAS